MGMLGAFGHPECLSRLKIGPAPHLTSFPLLLERQRSGDRPREEENSCLPVHYPDACHTRLAHTGTAGASYPVCWLSHCGRSGAEASLGTGLPTVCHRPSMSRDGGRDHQTAKSSASGLVVPAAAHSTQFPIELRPHSLK